MKEAVLETSGLDGAWMGVIAVGLGLEGERMGVAERFEPHFIGKKGGRVMVERTHGKSETLSYEGSVFQLWLEPGEKGWRAAAKEATSPCLVLPEKYQDLPVSSFQVGPQESIFGVKTLILSKNLRRLEIWNGAFPDLLEVRTVPGGIFFSEGGMILSDGKRDGSREDHLKVLFGSVDEFFSLRYQDEPYLRLLYVLRAGEQEELILPRSVRSIAARALEGARCRKIHCEREDLLVEERALDGSAWAMENEVLCTRDTLVYVASSSPEVTLPPGVDQIGKHAFLDHVPQELEMDSLRLSPGRKLPEGMPKIRRLRLRKVEDPLDERMLSSLSALEEIYTDLTLGEQGGLLTDGAVIHFCPRGRKEDPLFLPSGTRLVAREAFAQVAGIGRVRLPEGILMLEERAFHGSGLREITLPEGLEKIGRDCFADTRLQEISLPLSLEEVGEGALDGVERVSAYRGTARGLISGLHQHYSQLSLKRRVWIRVRDKAGKEEEEIFLVPRYLTLPGRRYLSDAWDLGFSLEEYEKAARYATDEGERLTMLLIIRLHGQGNEEVLGESASLSLGRFLIGEGPFDLFRGFLPLCHPGAREELLALCNERGRSDWIPYLLSFAGGAGKDFSL